MEFILCQVNKTNFQNLPESLHARGIEVIVIDTIHTETSKDAK